MASKLKARIVGMGSYLPEKILTNHELEKLVDTSDEWIISRTGMKERRIAAREECTSHMGAASAKKALEAAGVSSESIEMIIVTTMTPDYLSPSTAGIIQHALRADKAAAVDVQAACSGFLYGLSMAKAYVESGMYSTVLVVASEKMSAFLDYTDRNTCILFGDGASSAVVSSKGKGFLVEAVHLGADGSLADLIIIPGGGARNPASSETVDQKKHVIQLQGKEVFKHAVRRMAAAAEACLKAAGLSEGEISWLVPHQANERIIDAIAKTLRVPLEKVYKTVHKYGNTSASSIALALDELLCTKAPKKGDNILLVAFGAGLSWGASIVTPVAE